MIWIYASIALGMIVEGDLVLLSTAFASHERLIALAPAMTVAFVSVLGGDCLWYLLGRQSVGRWPRLQRLVYRLTRPLDPILSRQPFLAVLISKFTYGLNHAILVRAGLEQAPAKKYFKTILAANLIWVSALGGLGYFASSSFKLLRHYVEYGEVALVGALIIFFLLDRAIGRLIKNLIERE